MAEYIVKSSDYSFDSFEHKGLGGVQKYIAVPADTSKTKLIVKHEMSYSACNEFVASHIATAIGIKGDRREFCVKVNKQLPNRRNSG